MVPTPAEQSQKAARLARLLIEHYGEPAPRGNTDPLSELVLTILSQNTADVNSSRAYDSLRSLFPSWEELLTADTDEIARAIQIGGLAHIKAPRIQQILRQLQAERGRLSLDFLATMPLEEARRYLTALHGVGPKTAACVLLFALRRPVFPVDTHVHRVTRRLGLVPTRATPEKTGLFLEGLVPPESYYTLHVNLIRHGRALCKAGHPLCELCPLAPECDYLNLGRKMPDT